MSRLPSSGLTFQYDASKTQFSPRVETAAHLHNLLRKSRQEFKRKYCLHPAAPNNCSARIVSAHTVQRAMLAKHIADNGHVVRFKVQPTAEPMGMIVEPERVGLNKASTFFGFCEKHDSELFRPLETKEFNFSSHQIALLGYRAICRELYLKEAAIAAGDAARDYVAMNPDIPQFPEKEIGWRIMRLAHLNARKNLERGRKAFGEMLASEENTSLRYFGAQFEDRPVYFASAAFLPEWDFNGRVLQDLSQLEDFYPICFSAWATKENSAAVFCWHKSADGVCMPFVDSLRESQTHRLANRILGMAFEYSENIVFRSDWWEKIPRRDRQYLTKRVMSGVDDATRSAKSLLDGGLKALQSNVICTYEKYD
jgi:hypothetical protein